MHFTINGTTIGNGSPPYIIAELSANHNGSLKRALRTIDAAKVAGADAVKFQTYTAETMTIESDFPEFTIRGGLWDGYKLYDLYKWAETPYEWHKEMFDYARRIGITAFSTPFDESAVDLLEDLNSPAYKIASFEIVDLPLIRYVASTGKPMIMSTGGASEEEIEEGVDAAREAGCCDLVLLHCISSYPAPSEESNLRQIPELKRRFNTLTGLSDHTVGTSVAVAGAVLGAVVIEKHFTLNRDSGGPDSSFSLEPTEFATLCRDSKNAWLALGKAGFSRPKSEQSTKVFRRSLYFVNDITQGEIITENDIRRIRPGNGLSPKYLDQVIGKKVKRQVKAGQAVRWDLLD